MGGARVAAGVAGRRGIEAGVAGGRGRPRAPDGASPGRAGTRPAGPHSAESSEAQRVANRWPVMVPVGNVRLTSSATNPAVALYATAVRVTTVAVTGAGEPPSRSPLKSRRLAGEVTAW